MIAFLQGKVIAKQQNYVIILVNQIGYKVFVNQKLIDNLVLDIEASLYIHQHVKEDQLDLFGFQTKEELELFELLISVSGVGPKSALNFLSIASVREIKESIIMGDFAILTKVAGIGRKMAERVVLELKNKVGGLVGDQTVDEVSARNDEIDALMGLGYSIQQAREALKQVNPTLVDSGERVKEALKIIK
ncbi:MAG: Holliday junction branch migration protein RuvA [bacterium]